MKEAISTFDFEIPIIVPGLQTWTDSIEQLKNLEDQISIGLFRDTSSFQDFSNKFYIIRINIDKPLWIPDSVISNVFGNLYPGSLFVKIEIID